MSKVVLYIAASLDGYIAGKNDDLSWLDPYQGRGEDYGYSDFIKTIGTAIMGSRTYERSLKHPEQMIHGLKTYVLSERLFPLLPDGNVKFYSGNLEALVTKVMKENKKDVWIVGGGQVVSSFLHAGLVDDVIHFVVPVLLNLAVLHLK